MAYQVARETRATTALRATPCRAPRALRGTRASPEIRDPQVAGGRLEQLESAAMKDALAPRELEGVPARARARARRACRVSWVPRASWVRPDTPVGQAPQASRDTQVYKDRKVNQATPDTTGPRA